MVCEPLTAVMPVAYGDETDGAHTEPPESEDRPYLHLGAFGSLSFPTPSCADSTIRPGPPHAGGCGQVESAPFLRLEILQPLPQYISPTPLLGWGGGWGVNTDSLGHKWWFRTWGWRGTREKYD